VSHQALLPVIPVKLQSCFNVTNVTKVTVATVKQRMIGEIFEMNKLTTRFYLILQALREEHGQDLIEYVLIGGVVGLAAIAGMSNLASNLNTAFGTIGGHISSNVT
jgi:pilus assembly protein Flp/PilA